MARVGSNHHAVRWSCAMNFLEAHRLVQSFAGGPSHPLRVVFSGTGDPLALYLQAAPSPPSLPLHPPLLPFNPPAHHLLEAPDQTPEVFLLLPWDLATELDWRSGIPSMIDQAAIVERARATAERIRRRNACVAYIPAVVPPVQADPDRTRE